MKSIFNILFAFLLFTVTLQGSPSQDKCTFDNAIVSSTSDCNVLAPEAVLIKTDLLSREDYTLTLFINYNESNATILQTNQASVADFNLPIKEGIIYKPASIWNINKALLCLQNKPIHKHYAYIQKGSVYNSYENKIYKSPGNELKAILFYI